MPRSREELERAAAEAEAWLDQLDPDDPDVHVKVIRPWPGHEEDEAQER